MRYYYRRNGLLVEVHPLTIPHRQNKGVRKIKIVRTGEVVRARDGELVRREAR